MFTLIFTVRSIFSKMSSSNPQKTDEFPKIIEETYVYIWDIFVASKAKQIFRVPSKTGVTYRWEIGLKTEDNQNFTPYLKLLSPTYLSWTMDPVHWTLSGAHFKFRYWYTIPRIKTQKPVFNYPEITSPDLNQEFSKVFKIGVSSQITSKLVVRFDAGPANALAKVKSVSSNVTMDNLLADKESADLTIICSDGEKLRAHKDILKNAQSPVLASMLNSDIVEANTGILNLKDISSPVMNLLLRYLYTGDLHDDWKNPESIIEFTYAAAKLLLTDVLNLLDYHLSSLELGENLMPLLVMVNHLGCLQQAERELLKRAIDTQSNLEDCPEFMKIYKSVNNL